MEYLLPRLTTKMEVDDAIKGTEDKVLVLRFGKENDPDCMKVDDIILKTADLLKNMAVIFTVDVGNVPIYVQYFEIDVIPSTVFFFNGQHIKVDYGGPDHTKYVGPFRDKQSFVDIVEFVFRGAMAGKSLVTLHEDRFRTSRHELIFKNI